MKPRGALLAIVASAFAAAVAATPVATADLVNVNAAGCNANGGNVNRPAGTINIQAAWGATTLGLVRNFLNAETTTLTVNGAVVPESALQYSAPAFNQSVEAWLTRMEYPTGITLAAGDTMTFTLKWTLAHPVFDGTFDANRQPILWTELDLGTCTVHAV